MPWLTFDRTTSRGDAPRRATWLRASPDRGLLIALLLSVCAGAALANAPGTIATVAGGGIGPPGDGGPATAARLSSPRGLAVDRSGNLYLSDGARAQIRRVGIDGIITLVAGQGGVGDAGDGGPALQALFENPTGIAIDASGNLYIADTGNHRIRKIDAAGIVTTVAGSDQGGFAGDGGPATAAQLFSPQGVALDAGGVLYIADTGNHRVRRVDRMGIITTVAGTGNAGFSGDDGPALQARIGEPEGMAVDAAGDLYFADALVQRVRRVAPDGTIRTVAGNGVEASLGDGKPATSASLSQPVDVVVDRDGNLYVADDNAGRVRKVDAAGLISTVVGTGEYASSGDGGPANQAAISWPAGLAIDARGDLFVADSCFSKVREVFEAAAPGLLYPAPERRPGDVNGDGRVDVADAVRLLRALVGAAALAPDERAAADVNGDGAIDVRDVVLILDRATGRM